MSAETRYETRGEAIGYTTHEGRDGWTFNVLWEPGMGADALRDAFQTVSKAFIRQGEARRTEEIGRLLGVRQ